jgi:carboxyl-terminal processing protease
MKKMNNWKKFSIILTIVILAISLIVSSPPKTSSPFLQVSEQELLAKALPLCRESSQIPLKFEIIDAAYLFIKHYSIFREQAEKPEYLIQEMTKRTFQFLSRPIPNWAQEIINEEINENDKFSPASLAKKIYDQLLQDSQYQDLTTLSGKNTFIKASINALIKAIQDPFAVYVPPEEWMAQGKYESTAGSYRGMGISLNKNERGEIVINAVREGTPAQKVGLEVGDVILTIDGKRTDSCSVLQFVNKIKSRKNPNLEIIVKKKRSQKLQRINIALERIEILDLATYPAVELPSDRGDTAKGVVYRTPLENRQGIPQPDIVYILIKQFTVQAAQDLGFFLQSLDYSKVSGIIVDLRKNPGGVLPAIVDSVDYFLTNADLIIYEEEALYDPFSDETTVSSYAVRQNKYNFVPADIPIVILVSRESFSGAELFAGALRDHHRAVIISRDERTGGKGTVNRHYELIRGRDGNQGALYIAIGWWKTPSGELIELRDLDGDGYEEVGGLKPDVRVEWTDEDYSWNDAEPAFYDPTLFEAIDYINGADR